MLHRQLAIYEQTYRQSMRLTHGEILTLVVPEVLDGHITDLTSASPPTCTLNESMQSMIEGQISSIQGVLTAGIGSPVGLVQ